MQPIRFVLGFFFYIIHIVAISLIYYFWDIKVDPTLYFGFLMLAPIWSFTIFESFASCLAYELFLYLLALFLWPQTGPFSFTGLFVFTILMAGVSIGYLLLNLFLEWVAVMAGIGACNLEEEEGRLLFS